MTTPERWQHIERLYHAALAREDGERPAFVREVCAGDETLREEVESLLARDARAEAFLTELAAEAFSGLLEPDPDRVLEGITLGAYRIERLLGRGGMGAVFLAYDTRLDRSVALKLVDAPADGDTARSRLLREARNAAALNHPNICTIHEVGEANGLAFIAMEYVEGRSLRARLQEGALELVDAIRYGIQTADALAYAHDHGVIHRDFKAANAIVTEAGRLKIVDFGLARRADAVAASATIMSSGVPVGTPTGTPYAMAPEQVRGETADARTDVWALGVLLYEMVAGAKPFHGATIPEVFSAILRDPPAALPDAVPVEMRSLIERCLAKEPERRYQRADDVRTALEAIQAGTVTPWIAWRYRMNRRRGLVFAAALFTLGAMLVGFNVRGWRDRLVGNAPAAAPLKLAVLPLEDLSGGADQQHFAAGTHDALVTALARISALRVTARSSVLRYKGTQKTASEIARELNVDAILTGSVSRSGDRIRITAQLIDATTESHLWADTYERAVRDVLSLQNEIVAAITGQVRLQLTPEEKARLSRARPVDPEAYEAYLRGMFHLNQLTPEGVEKGLALLQTAVAKDPGHPLPYAQLAIGYAALGHGPSPPPDAFARARAAALQALALDDTVAQAHEVLAELTMYDERTWDWPAAERGFRRALELNPALAQAYAHYGWYLVLFDRFDEALASVRRAQEVDPLSPTWPAMQAFMYCGIRRYDEAIREAQKSLELNPKFPLAFHVLGIAYSGKGMHEEALAAHERAGAFSPGFKWGLGYTYALIGRRADALRIAAELPPTRVNTLNRAYIYAALGDRDGAFRWVQAAYEQRHGEIPWIRNNPVLAPLLRDDPRFADLVRRMKLPS